MKRLNPPEGTIAHDWLGAREPYLDDPMVIDCGPFALGFYGGNTRSGANKNEDAAYVLADSAGHWEFAMVVDAHFSAESADLLIDLVTQEADSVRQRRDDAPFERMFRQLEDHIVSVFSSPEAMSRAMEVEGEASCLLCARNDRFLWWMNVGDCQAYLFYPEFAARGQFALNQRSYFEWIGFRNAFANAVPCYASGVRELLPGQNVICLATDGVFEGDREPLVPAPQLYQAYMADFEPSARTLAARTSIVLNRIHQLQGRDSATIIVWSYTETGPGV